MKIPRRRRLEKKTDYKSRFSLLKSGKNRLIVRKTNRYLITQLIETNIAQDKVIIGVTSKDLLELGWPKQKEGSLKSIMASYLTGILIGKLAKEKRIESAIFDIGMNRNVSKSRVFALLKGAIDSGMKIPYNPDSLPTEEDLLKNQNLKGLFKLKEKIQGSSNK